MPFGKIIFVSDFSGIHDGAAESQVSVRLRNRHGVKFIDQRIAVFHDFVIGLLICEHAVHLPQIPFSGVQHLRKACLQIQIDDKASFKIHQLFRTVKMCHNVPPRFMPGY